MAVEAESAPVEQPLSTFLVGQFDAIVRSYAQLFFARSRWVGGLLIASTAVEPRFLVAGLLSVALASVIAQILRFSPDMLREGLFGYNALLVGLGGVAMFGVSSQAWVLTGLGVVASVFLTAALQSTLGQLVRLPALTVPFLLVFYAMLAMAPQIGIIPAVFPPTPGVELPFELPATVVSYLSGLGMIFFLPYPAAGLLVFVAVVVWSRIGALLSVLGYAAAAATVAWLFPGTPPTFLWLLSLNFTFVAIAIGGVWFVPRGSSFLLALVATLVAGVVAGGSYAVLGQLGLPILILPFNATVFLVLVAMRQRVRDGRPKAVDFTLGTPEENLNHYQTRVLRFGSRYGVRISAPFLGRWVCTQAVDGEYTHKGPWRHALDFEVQDPDGAVFRGAGARVEDYLCYGLPVISPAEGTVAWAVDGVPDNAIGEVNVRENWGNVVVIYHGPGLYSLMAHLAPGSVKARVGQVVRRGEVVAACGNSGRSPQPHLHFNLQALPQPGAPTLEVELHDVVQLEDRAPRLRCTAVPDQGTELRNIEPEAALAAFFHFSPYEPVIFQMEGRREPESFVPRVDLLGQFTLASKRYEASLVYAVSDALFTSYDVVGDRRSVLHLVHLACPRVPFEHSEGLQWVDHLPPRALMPRPLRPVFDLVAPFMPWRGVAMRYGFDRDGLDVVVHGRSMRMRGEVPVVETFARFRQGEGLVSVEVCRLGRRERADRVAPDARTPSEGATTIRSSSRSEHRGT